MEGAWKQVDPADVEWQELPDRWWPRRQDVVWGRIEATGHHGSAGCYPVGWGRIGWRDGMRGL